MGNPIQDLIDRYNQLTEYRISLERRLNEANRDNSILNQNDWNIHNRYNQTMANYKREINAKNGQLRALQRQYDRISRELNQLKQENSTDDVLIRAQIDKLTELSAKITFLKKQIYILYLTQFETIISQNTALKNTFNKVEDDEINFNKKGDFYNASIETLKFVNSVFFFTYCIIALVAIYILYFRMPLWNKYYKVLFFIFIVSYPYFIAQLENAFYYTFSNLLTAIKGDPIITLNDSKLNIINETTDLSTKKP
jgi:hypothetical protein